MLFLFSISNVQQTTNRLVTSQMHYKLDWDSRLLLSSWMKYFSIDINLYRHALKYARQSRKRWIEKIKKYDIVNYLVFTVHSIN